MKKLEECARGNEAVPVDQWPKIVDEPVLLYVVHDQAQYEDDPAKRKSLWEAWFQGTWTDFNGGGWTWGGMCGRVTHVARLPMLPMLQSVLDESKE